MGTSPDNAKTTICLLADAPDVIPVLAELFAAEWKPYYGSEGPGDATADLTGCLNRDEIPLAIVALTPDGAPAGTAALKANSVGDELDGGPWLTALLVRPDCRKRGIGSALIEAIERQARRLGHSGLVCSTDRGETLLQRRGWRRIGESQSLRGTVPVYRLEFSEAP